MTTVVKNISAFITKCSPPLEYLHLTLTLDGHHWLNSDGIDEILLEILDQLPSLNRIGLFWEAMPTVKDTDYPRTGPIWFPKTHETGKLVAEQDSKWWAGAIRS